MAGVAEIKTFLETQIPAPARRAVVSFAMQMALLEDLRRLNAPGVSLDGAVLLGEALRRHVLSLGVSAFALGIVTAAAPMIADQMHAMVEK